MAASALPGPLYFVLPDDKSEPSGGNIYNARLIAALRDIGQEVEELDFVHYQKSLQSGTPGVFGVDLQQMSTVVAPGQFSFFILHHLESLHPPTGQEADVLFQQERQVLEQFDLILATSTFSSDYLLSRGVGVPVAVVEPALSTSASTKPIPAKLPLRGLMVANVVERKGILDFLHALLNLGTAGDEFLLTIIGRQDMEPAYFRECRQLVERSFLKEKVKFTGALSHQQTLEHYHQNHILVSAARMETFGMAIQEARAAGLGLLVLEGGYSGKHVADQNGKLCTDIFELAGNFLQFSRNEDQLQAFLAATARRVVVQQPYNWEQAAALFLQKIRHFL